MILQPKQKSLKTYETPCTYILNANTFQIPPKLKNLRKIKIFSAKKTSWKQLPYCELLLNRTLKLTYLSLRGPYTERNYNHILT